MTGAPRCASCSFPEGIRGRFACVAGVGGFRTFGRVRLPLPLTFMEPTAADSVPLMNAVNASHRLLTVPAEDRPFPSRRAAVSTPHARINPGRGLAARDHPKARAMSPVSQPLTAPALEAHAHPEARAPPRFPPVPSCSSPNWHFHRRARVDIIGPESPSRPRPIACTRLSTSNLLVPQAQLAVVRHPIARRHYHLCLLVRTPIRQRP